MATLTNEEFINRIMETESGGRRYDKNGKLLEGPKTRTQGRAKGEMQVVDKTNFDPGFGVTPAKNKSPDERARVGKDYAQAMLDKYDGDRQHAAMAYNWGPGNVDKWLSSGKKSGIPEETRNYVVKVTGAPIGGQQVAKQQEPQPAAPAAAPAPRPFTSPRKATPFILGQADAVPFQERIAALGPSYHTAMALAYLADNTDEDDPAIQAYKERTGESASSSFFNEESPAPALSKVDLTAQSPFQEPVTAAHGGMIHRAKGSPEEGENSYFQDPMGVADSGPVTADTRAPSKAPSARAMLDMVKDVGSGAARNVKNLALGAADLPYDVAGTPVDLATMAMRPFGYKTEKPVGGSEYLKEKATKLGVRVPDSKDSQDQGFRLAGEIGAAFVNPASVIRGGTKAADMLRKAYGKPAPVQAAPQAQQFIPALPEPNEELANRLQTARTQRAVEQNLQTAETAAAAHPPGWQTVDTGTEIQAAVEPPVPPIVPEVIPVAPPAKVIPNVPADRPFVGRLDQLVDSLSGPVQKQQFVNQVKKNLRDYDVQRLEEALKDLPANAKLSPDQLREALGQTYSPSKFISEDLPVKAGGYHKGVDNIFDKDLGTTNLYLELPAERIEHGKRIGEIDNVIRDFAYFHKDVDGNLRVGVDDLRKAIESSDQVKNNPAAQSLLSKVDAYATDISNFEKQNRTLSQGIEGLMYPILYKNAQGEQLYFKIKNAVYDGLTNSPYTHSQRDKIAYDEATKQVAQDAYTRLVNAGVDPQQLPNIDAVFSNPPHELSGIDSHALFRSTPEAKAALENAVEPLLQTYNDLKVGIQRDITPEVREVRNLLEGEAPYKGQHASVAKQPHPIGFSRYTEHEVALPGMGEVKGRHFHELQSDLAQDIRQKGPQGGSLERDEAELATLRQKAGEMRANPQHAETELAKIDNRILTVSKRMQKTKKGGGYNLEQPFAGFETSPSVEQQLLMKNSIQATMRSGGRFATFPGAESAQAGLYEKKVPINLKQVVKDLGGEKSGFEIKNITLQDKDGNPVLVHGVAWSPEAADRVMREGVKFRHGGSVERRPDDNRRYL